MADFPKALYKRGEQGKGNVQPVWNIGWFEVKHAENTDEEAAAIADGWTVRPDDEPVKKPAKPTA